MAVKIVAMPGIGWVELRKRRGSRSIRVSIQPNGSVRVVMPFWVPFATGIAFVEAKRDWILSHVEKTARAQLVDGQPIGKAHHLSFVVNASLSAPTSRVTITEIIIQYAPPLGIESPVVQAKARQACIRALRKQAEQLLPQRLALLAQQHNFSYRNVGVKQLKRRWGSCDQHHSITLNLFLMQLPWDLIDYVLVHELVHTEHLNHSGDFWTRFLEAMPDAKDRRKRMRQHQPAI